MVPPDLGAVTHRIGFRGDRIDVTVDGDRATLEGTAPFRLDVHGGCDLRERLVVVPSSMGLDSLVVRLVCGPVTDQAGHCALVALAADLSAGVFEFGHRAAVVLDALL